MSCSLRHNLCRSNISIEKLQKRSLAARWQFIVFSDPGFPEIIYERSLIIELRRCGINCGSQVEKDIYYCGDFVGKRRLDVIVEEKVLVELKAVSEIQDDSYNKILNYLKVFGFEVGLLLNFGKSSLQFKRFALSKNLRNPLNP
jgi:GxxExxY protein